MFATEQTGLAHTWEPEGEAFSVYLGDKAMNTTSSSFRTNDQLAAILDEVSDWVVTGRQGKGLCHAASLRLAIDRGADYAASGAVVIALRRLPSDKIIVFPVQIANLRKVIAGQEQARIEEWHQKLASD
jgi:hypothetical protein